MKKKMDMKGIIGVSGEFFVAAELSQRGIVATMTLKNTPYIDILATNLEKAKTANIQVKTMSIRNNAGWHLGPKDGEPSGIANHFYVLVNLQGQGKLPEYIILPKEKFSVFLKVKQEKWESGKKRDGTPRKKTTMWIFDPNRNEHSRKFAEKYINNWSILDLW
ncbi:MAG: hypothetical protein WC671_02750 [Candidatus Paceibacterota bacterium]|jgi:hypothetical protein